MAMGEVTETGRLAARRGGQEGRGKLGYLQHDLLVLVYMVEQMTLSIS